MRRLVPVALLASLLTSCAQNPPIFEPPSSPPAAATPSVLPESPPEKTTDPEKLTLDLKTLPGYQAPEEIKDGTFRKPMVDGGWVEWTIFEGKDVVKGYKPPKIVAFGDPETYSSVPGVPAWRGNHARTAPAYGTPKITAKKIEPLWSHPIGSTWTRNLSGRKNPDGTPAIDLWNGAGWTGQPIIVDWPNPAREAMGLAPGIVEVLYPVFDGQVYRLDLATGKPTKPPISTTFSYKGTGLIHPAGLPLFFAGQGLDEAAGQRGPFQYRIFDLVANNQVAHLPGADPVAPRNWGAFDSSALINWQTDTLFEVGENGLFYKVALNSSFVNGQISLDPKVTKLRWRTSASSRLGAESSLVAYRNLLYFSDNDGNLLCVDANSLEVVWARQIGDDADATMVLDESPDGVFLYHGNEIDHRQNRDPNANLRKIDALTGKIVWQRDVPTIYHETSNGGVLGSPILGRGNTENLVFFNVARAGSETGGLLLALDRRTGNPKWERKLPFYSWSSPVIVLAEDGKSYGLLCDGTGKIQLFDAATGAELSRASVGANCESSPAVYGSTVVVASWAQKIYAFKIS